MNKMKYLPDIGIYDFPHRVDMPFLMRVAVC